MAEYPIHPYIIHCLELLLANATAPVVLALDGRCGSGKTTMAAALAEQFPDSIVLHTDDLQPAARRPCARLGSRRLVPIWTLPACGTRCWARPARVSRCCTVPIPAGEGAYLPGAGACRTAAGDFGGQLQPPPAAGRL